MSSSKTACWHIADRFGSIVTARRIGGEAKQLERDKSSVEGCPCPVRWGLESFLVKFYFKNFALNGACWLLFWGIFFFFIIMKKRRNWCFLMYFFVLHRHFNLFTIIISHNIFHLGDYAVCEIPVLRRLKRSLCATTASSTGSFRSDDSFVFRIHSKTMAVDRNSLPSSYGPCILTMRLRNKRIY